MNPFKYAQMMKYLTRVKKQKPDLPDVFPASKAPIPAKTQNVEDMEAVNRFVRANPRKNMAGGGMLVQPSADGSRPGYAKPKLYEKYSQYFFKKPYSEIKPNTKEYYKIHNAIKSAGGKFRAPKSKKGIRFRKELENKILKAYPNADFEKYGRFGFPKTTGTREQFLNYTRVRDFIARGFKTGVRDKLPVAVQRAIMIKFENDVPKNFKWDFNKPNQKYGIPETSKGGKYNVLGKRITNFVNNPTPEHRLWNYQTPEGWMMSVMNRNFMQYGDELYEPLFDKVNGKNTIVGFKDKTNFGKGKDYYYGIKRAKDRNGVHVRNHPDFDNTKKYFNIASKIKDPPNKTIQKILKQGNVTIDGRLTLNNLLNYLINEKGRIQTNRALVLHHKGGLKLRATGDYQLLDRLTNAKITGVEDAMRSGDITKENIDFLKKNNASVIIDGVTYGGGPKTAEEGFKQTEKFVEKKLKKEIKTDPQLKNFKRFIATLSKDPRCSRGFNSQGGRAGFQEGTPPSLDVCYQGGVRNINSGMKNVTPAQAKNFAAFANRAASLGRGVMKYGIVPEALYVAADSLIRVGMGDNFNEAFLRATEYLRPGDQTKLAETLEADRFFGPEIAGIINKSLSYKNELAKVQSLEDQKANLENLSGGGAFDYIGNLSQDVKNIDAQIKQATDNLNNKFKITDAERIYAERMQDEVDDARGAGSLFTKLKSKFRDVGQDQSDIETLGVPEKTQEQLNQRILNQSPIIYKVEDGKLTEKNLSEATQTEIMNHVKLLKPYGVNVSTKNLLEQRNVLRGMPLSQQEQIFGKEATYGASGTMGEPINKPVFKRPKNVIGDIEKEIVGQTNVANPFDIDISDIGTGLRGFSAAGGGIAKMAGVSSGPPPESGPMSQGLQGLMKRVRNR